jgi:hypothetical protein
LFVYLGPELLDALFGLPNKQSPVPKERATADAQECFVDDRPVVAIVRMTLIISSSPPSRSDPTRWSSEITEGIAQDRDESRTETAYTHRMRSQFKNRLLVSHFFLKGYE